MTTNVIQVASALSGVAPLVGNDNLTPTRFDCADLVQRIRSGDEVTSGAAWQSAELYGPAAVKPLAGLMADPDFELARKGKRALYRIVRHVSRPEAMRERAVVEAELISLLQDQGSSVRRDVLWMLSEIGGNNAVEPIAALLTEPEVREDARCALTRIPGKRATAALHAAFATTPEQFKFALAESLRIRGEKVEGYPNQRLVPSKPTTVTALPESSAHP